METTIGFNEYLLKGEDIKIRALAEQAGKEIAKLIQKGEDPDYIGIMKKWVPNYKTHDEVLQEGFKLYKETYVYEASNKNLYGKYLLFLAENGCNLETLEFPKNKLYEDEFNNPAMSSYHGGDPDVEPGETNKDAGKKSPQEQYNDLFGQFSTSANAHLAKDRSLIGYVKRAGSFILKTFKGMMSGIGKAFGSLKGLVTSLYKRLTKPFGTIGAGLILTIVAVLIFTGPIWLPSIAGIGIGTVIYGIVFGYIGKKIGENVGTEIVKAHGGSKFAQNVGGFIGKITGAAAGAGGGKLLAGVVHNQGLLLVGKICTLHPKLDSIFGRLLPVDKSGNLLPPDSGATDQVAKQAQEAAKKVDPKLLDQGTEAAGKAADKAGGAAKQGMENLANGKQPPTDAGSSNIPSSNEIPADAGSVNTPSSNPYAIPDEVPADAGSVNTPSSNPYAIPDDAGAAATTTTDSGFEGVKGAYQKAAQAVADSHNAGIPGAAEVAQQAAENVTFTVPPVTQDIIQNAVKAGQIANTSPTQINALLGQPLNPTNLRTLGALIYDPNNIGPYNALMKSAGPELVKYAFHGIGTARG
jgi:hypothetical protein